MSFDGTMRCGQTASLGYLTRNTMRFLLEDTAMDNVSELVEMTVLPHTVHYFVLPVSGHGAFGWCYGDASSELEGPDAAKNDFFCAKGAISGEKVR